jgi:hypothetical protein
LRRRLLGRHCRKYGRRVRESQRRIWTTVPHGHPGPLSEDTDRDFGPPCIPPQRCCLVLPRGSSKLMARRPGWRRSRPAVAATQRRPRASPVPECSRGIGAFSGLPKMEVSVSRHVPEASGA